MKQITQAKLTSKLGLTSITLPKTDSAKPESINHVLAVDVSWSMSGDLPKLRQHLKNRIPDIVSAEDTISIIWFSSRNQCGFVKEMVKIDNPQSLSALNSAIDRFIVPVGCTSFLDPVELTEQLIEANGGVYSFIFMTDGYNNDSPFNEVLAKLDTLAGKVIASTFIEYGYYADSKAIEQMSSTVGGSHIVSTDFENYAHDFEAAITNKPKSMLKTVDISTLKDMMSYQMLWYTDNEQIFVISTSRKTEILIPDHINKLFTISECKPDENVNLMYSEMSTAAYVMSRFMKYQMTETILNVLADRHVTSEYMTAFGKSRLETFKSLLLDVTFNESKRFQDGFITMSERSAFLVNAASQYCLIDLLADLRKGGAKLCLGHDEFQYNRTTAKSIEKITLTDKDKDAIASASTITEAKGLIDNLQTATFEKDTNDLDVEIGALIYNEDRANISVRVKIPGYVHFPKNDLGLETVKSFVYRNYTILKDGIINVPRLPIKIDSVTTRLLNAVDKNMSNEDRSKLKENGAADTAIVLHLDTLPLTNRKNTTTVFAKQLAENKVNLLINQAKRKALDYYIKMLPSDRNVDGGHTTYSQEAAEYMKQLGVDKYKGFSPKRETVKSPDSYMADRIRIAVASHSSIPSVKKVVDKRISGKKMTPSETLFNARLFDAEYMYNTCNSDELIAEQKNVDNACIDLLQSIALSKLSLILSRKAFVGHTIVDGLSVEVDGIDGQKYTVKYIQDMEKVSL